MLNVKITIIIIIITIMVDKFQWRIHIHIHIHIHSNQFPLYWGQDQAVSPNHMAPIRPPTADTMMNVKLYKVKDRVVQLQPYCDPLCTNASMRSK